MIAEFYDGKLSLASNVVNLNCKKKKKKKKKKNTCKKKKKKKKKIPCHNKRQLLCLMPLIVSD